MEKLKYPNPQFIRKNWIDLNGVWDFCFDDADQGMTGNRFTQSDFFTKKINVPYSYHTKSSGLEIKEDHQIVWYQRSLIMNKDSSKHYLLHFGAVDYECEIWVNGIHVMKHSGGHTPFCVDVTEVITEENQITVRVKDENSSRQPLGKQSWKEENFLCWYTRTVGIWQQVWMEETGSCYLDDLRMTPDIDNASIEIDATVNQHIPGTRLAVRISYAGVEIKSASLDFYRKRARFSLDVSSDDPNFRLNFWSPGTPNLYDIEFVVSCGEHVTDQVDSYFGMRSVDSRNQKIYLNNQEFFQKLVLDQGYFKDGGLTATVDELKNDVCKIKEMGFNGVRKHQKIEDHRFMYLCDVMGLAMWAEMPSPFEYSAASNENMTREIYPFVSKHYNHPSVIVYTVMNESWGINEVVHNKKQQNFVNMLYYLIKSLDSGRLVVGNDGWEHTITDILTIHDYSTDVKVFADSYRSIEQVTQGSPSKTSGRYSYCHGYQHQNVPVMVSEYGGLAYEKGQEGNSWGYGKRLGSAEEILERIEQLTKVLMDSEGITGFCYTQLSDVEQEVNGLLDYDHQYKFDPQEIRSIMEYKYNIGFVFV